jgi:crotonobetainyl-CoA:carnitine CoA-transferase CaiB-like acyl-CoA transferase
MNLLPLAGLNVIEFSTMVMGPTCGQILADLGAEVIKVEPLGRGDRTRDLTGLGAGFFTAFNRGKKSVAIDTGTEQGLEAVRRLIAGCDVMIENFRPGLMRRLGLDYASVAKIEPRLVYCSLKGFLPGPYENRTALDEVVQMMGGLAYMTGLPGRPMRAGASVNDIMGAMFGVIGIQAALREREATGRGQEVQASLYENTAFLMGQSMLAHAINGGEETPMSVQARPWPIYDLFDVADGSQLFIAVVGDSQWAAFCKAFERPDLAADERLGSNAARAAARDWLLPEIQLIIDKLSATDLLGRLNAIGIPFAPVRTPGELARDEHLLASGGLIDVDLPGGGAGKMPAIPLRLGDRRPHSAGPVAPVGEHTVEILVKSGFSRSEIDALHAAGVIEVLEGG